MDFVKYFPNVLGRDICSLIVDELKEVISYEGQVGSTRINGKECISLIIDSDNMTFPLLAEAIKKVKVRYIKAYPRYKKFINFSSGEFCGVFEDIENKLLIQHYPENGFMKEHIDNTNQRTYIKANKTINLEHRHAQLSIIIMLNDDYDGGEFVVSEKSFQGEAGAAIIFPASFMYPHKVNVVRNGERWSCAAWLR